MSIENLSFIYNLNTSPPTERIPAPICKYKIKNPKFQMPSVVYRINATAISGSGIASRVGGGGQSKRYLSFLPNFSSFLWFSTIFGKSFAVRGHSSPLTPHGYVTGRGGGGAEVGFGRALATAEFESRSIQIPIFKKRWPYHGGGGVTQIWVGYGCPAWSFNHHPITKPEKMKICNLCLNHLFLKGPFFKKNNQYFYHVNWDA